MTEYFKIYLKASLKYSHKVLKALPYEYIPRFSRENTRRSIPACAAGVDPRRASINRRKTQIQFNYHHHHWQ